ncbi:MAG: hypothetical protein GXP38_10025 [Chloroflexi bacterium]|nr:hypothetical protein [Chloroflexota bacterium]
MSLNNLLIWMSARREGSWQQFRAAVEELHVESGDASESGGDTDDTAASDLPLYQAVRLDLQRLGHVEFFSTTTDKDWRVVPPVLSTIQKGERWMGVVCGARYPELYNKLRALDDSVSCEVLEVPGMPDRICLFSDSFEELQATARPAGFLVQENAPRALLSAIPPVDDPRSRVRQEPPEGPGWLIEKFSVGSLRWHQAERKEVERTQTGLFRFRMRYQRFHFLWRKGRSFRVHVQVGKYALLRYRRKRRILNYDIQRAVLSVPAICRPPFLIERALVLCSGLLPRYDRSSGRIEYAGIPRDVARLAAQLLCQEVQIHE